MKSIRSSLIIYVWLLLGLGLGAASILAYRIAADNLRTKQETNRKLLENQFDDRRREVEARFDEHLLAKARLVASQTQLEPQDRSNVVRWLARLVLMDDVQAQLTVPVMFQSTTRGLVTAYTPLVTRRLDWDIKLNDADLPRESSGNVAEYFQVDSDSGNHWPHQSPVDGKPFFEPNGFDVHKAVGGDWFADDVTLPNGKPGRRVQFKSTSTRFRFFFSRRPGGRPNLPPPTPERPASRPGERPPPPSGDRVPTVTSSQWMLVNCASETTQRDKAIEDYRAELHDDLQKAASEGQESLAQLRRRLIAIALVTFLLTTIGGYMLVGLGLAPLRRMTSAVSRVSPRDFKLPLPANEPLPRELSPIRDRLQVTLDELRKAFEREKQAAADISHELRTPVASLLTTVEVALRKPRTAEEYRQTLEDCRGSARQMRQLVERLLALARLDAGSDRIRPRQVEVGALVRECAALVKPLAGERSLELRVNCPKPVVWNTDPDKLREVIVNLLHNAIEYNRPEGAIDVSADASDGWLDVQVHDTGVGISQDAYEHIFERFYRADPSRQANEMHAGLGLSIVKGYVGLLGGTITVESQIGQGSTFRVRLPDLATAA